MCMISHSNYGPLISRAVITIAVAGGRRGRCRGEGECSPIVPPGSGLASGMEKPSCPTGIT